MLLFVPFLGSVLSVLSLKRRSGGMARQLKRWTMQEKEKKLTVELLSVEPILDGTGNSFLPPVMGHTRLNRFRVERSKS